MITCKSCASTVDESNVFCPSCGFRLCEKTEDYLWMREEQGEFIHKNFPSVRGEPVRETLGDMIHADLFSLQMATLLFNFPLFFPQVFRAARLMSYYSCSEANLAKKEDWKTFKDPKTVQAVKDIGLKQNTMDVKSLDADPPHGTVTWKVRDVPCSVRSPPPVKQCTLTFFLSGLSECLCDGNWAGEIRRCQSIDGDYCQVETKRLGESGGGFEEKMLLELSAKSPQILSETLDFGKKELDTLYTRINERKPYCPRDLGDFFHLSVIQSLNYLLVAPTPGHRILTKQCGRICGAKLAEKAGLKDAKETIEYLEDLFAYLKAGTMKTQNKKGAYTIELKESAYSAGTENLKQKICIFPAGLIEGALQQATGKKWNAEETHCTADGDAVCRIICKTII